MAVFRPRVRGYRMRSRIEARWCQAFDVMGWVWEYEPEGYFALGDGTAYLPDFFVLALGWVEIKARADESYDHELEMLQSVVDETGHLGYLFAGYIPDSEDERVFDGTYPYLSIVRLAPGGHRDDTVWPCACTTCGKISIESGARGDLVCDGNHMGDIDARTGGHPKLLEAYAAGRAWEPDEPQF